MEENPELIKDLDKKWLKKMQQCFFGTSYQSFIGAKNRSTPLHAGMTASFFIVAEGTKNWDIFPASYYPFFNPPPSGEGYFHSDLNVHTPDTTKYPGVNLLHRYQCQLKKGDILYLPGWMWHNVTNTSETWGVSYRFANIRSLLHQPTLTAVRILFPKLSFIKVIYYSFFSTNLGKRSENLMTPKLYKD
jgi:hypothetical protein